MRICDICGSKSVEDALYCENCGARLNRPTTPPVFAAPYVPPVPEAGEPAYAPAAPQIFSPVRPDGAAIGLVKTLGSSSLFLGLICTYALSLALTFAATLSGISSMTAYLNEAMVLTPVDLGGMPVVMTTVFTLLFLTPSVLTCVGMVRFYRSCRGPDSPPSPAGLNMIKTVKIVELCLFCAFCAIFVLLMSIGLSMMQSMPYNSGLAPAVISSVMTVYGVMLALFVALLVVYYLKIFKTIKAVTEVLRTGLPNPGASSLLMVLCWIGAVISVIVSLGMLADPAMVLDFPLLLAQLLSAASFVLTALCIQRYRRRMSALPPSAYVPPQEERSV